MLKVSTYLSPVASTFGQIVVLTSALVAGSERVALADEGAPKTSPAVDGAAAHTPAPIEVSSPALVTAPVAPPIFEPSPPTTRKTVWYGWQTMLADGASAGLVVIGMAANTSNSNGAYVSLGGVSGLVLGAPAVHGAHGNWGLAVADIGLRAGAVGLGAFVASEIDGGTKSTSRNELLVGATVGGLAMSMIDAAFLAKETPAPAETPSPSFHWTPAVSVLSGGGIGGVVGSF